MNSESSMKPNIWLKVGSIGLAAGRDAPVGSRIIDPDDQEPRWRPSRIAGLKGEVWRMAPSP